MSDLTEHQYHLTNLLLAERIAAAEGLSRHAAITRWARRTQAGRPATCQLRKTCQVILRAKPWHTLNVVRQLWNQLHADGVLEQPWNGDNN